MPISARIRVLRLTKIYPLTISRGTSAGSYNLFVLLSDGVHEGVGEAAPATADVETLAVEAEPSLKALFATGCLENGPDFTYEKARLMGIHPAAIAAVDIALWDLLAKQAQMPLYKMLGLEKPVAPTSVTIGINPPERVRELVPEMLTVWKARKLKIKLGSPEGLDHDKASYEAAREAAAKFDVGLRVDANGGWTPKGAIEMDQWLSERGCDYIEQPLAKGMESELPAVFARRRLPLFLDESVHFSTDVPAIADRCDGVNFKLMKTGGITEALRVIATARAHGLQIMIGCMSDSSIGIAAGAALGILCEHIDLDSHLNQNPDPAEGLKMVAGVVIPPDRPGHGAVLVE